MENVLEERTSKTSEAQKRASNAWDKAHTETLGLKFRNGVKDKLKTVAMNSNESLTMYMINAFKQRAIREGLLTEEQAETLLEEDPAGEWVKAYIEE